MLLHKTLLVSICLFISSLVLGQITASHSPMSSMNLCKTQSATITIVNTGNFSASVQLFVVLPSSSSVTYGSFTISSGLVNQSGDTLIIDSLPAISSVDLMYATTLNCDAFDINSYSLSNTFTFSLNSDTLITQSSNSYSVKQPCFKLSRRKST